MAHALDNVQWTCVNNERLCIMQQDSFTILEQQTKNFCCSNFCCELGMSYEPLQVLSAPLYTLFILVHGVHEPLNEFIDGP